MGETYFGAEYDFWVTIPKYLVDFLRKPLYYRYRAE